MINFGALKVFLRRSRATSFIYKKLFRQYHLIKRRFPRSYSSWIKQSESIAEYVSQEINNPILVIIDADGKSEKELSSLVQSIMVQDYPFWTVSIYYSADQNSKSFIKKISLKDERVALYHKDRYELAHEIMGVNGDDNCWLMMLTGNFLLSPHCLSEFNLSVNSLPNGCALVYSDHDELSRLQKREKPHFKPDWNPDLFYNQDYIENCCIYSAAAIIQLGNLKLSFTRDFFYDLTLRISKIDNNSFIHHVSKVLFHKRKKLAKLNPELAECSLRQALKNELIKVKSDDKHSLVINWPIPKNEPLVSLIIPTRNGYDFLKQAINSIVEKTTYKKYEIIIIDNQSDCQSTLDYLAFLDEQFTTINIVKYDLPFNYSAINNFAVRHANGEIIGFVNNDIEVISPYWLTEMVSHSVRVDIGCVGAKLYYENNTVQHAGVIIGMWGCAGHSHKHYKRASLGYCERLIHVQNYSAVTAACLLIKKQVFEQVGGFNEKDLPVQFNDVDLCLKVKNLNLNNLWTPYAELYHHESVSRGIDTKPEQIERANREVEYMHNTWDTTNYSDPAYNINLNYAYEDFSITRRK